LDRQGVSQASCHSSLSVCGQLHPATRHRLTGHVPGRPTQPDLSGDEEGGLRSALQSFRFRCLTIGVSVGPPSSRSWPLVQSLQPAEVPPAWVGRSRSAVGRFLGCAVFLRRTRGLQLSSRTILSASFALRQSITQRFLAVGRSRRLLSWAFDPYSAQGSEGPLLTGLPDPLRSARRVCLPSRRLSPFEPVPVLFHTGGTPGIQLRSFLLPQGIHAFPRERTHMPFLLPLLPPPKRTGRPGRPRLLGFDPCESPWRPRRC
jgi:hypothetical protein